MQRKGEMVEAMLLELELQRDYLQGAPLGSIYFGGGTPSLLSAFDLERIFDRIYALHVVLPGAEITLEANPDDLKPEKLQELRQTPINRLSIGVQSFSETDLRFMNRAHNASEAFNGIELALAAGFHQLTVDLIYGAPTTHDAQWAFNVETLLNYEIPHVSAYCLTVEEGTALAHFVRKEKAPAVNEEQAARQFEFLMDRMEEAGYIQYEISNFARPGMFARHNSSYWRGESYLGIGPSAHSFNGSSRQWNVANNSKYLRSLQEVPPGSTQWFEKEELSPVQRYHEEVMTGLRTVWGFDPDKAEAPYRNYFLEQVRPFLDQGLVQMKEGRYVLTRSGKLFADRIAMELFYG